MNTPEIWQVCEECGGSGFDPAEDFHDELAKCPHCAHSPRHGYRAILYTPEEWEQAGGVLHDDLTVFMRSKDLDGWWKNDWKNIKNASVSSNYIIIIAHHAITMKDLEEI